MKVRWTYTTAEKDPSGVEAGAAIVGGTVYVGDNAGVLHAIDLATGQARWRSAGSGDQFVTTPVVAGGKVLLGDMGGVFHAWDAATGKPAWTFEPDGGAAIHSSANLVEVAGEQRVVFGNDGARLTCLHVADGKLAWEATAGDRINATPAIGADGTVVFTGCDGRLRALDARDGSPRWMAEFHVPTAGAPALLEDRIIFGTIQGQVLCFARDGKRELWRYQTLEEDSQVNASPAVAAGIAVLGAQDRAVHAIDTATGQRRWIFKTRGDVDSTAVISGGRVYVGSKDKKLYVLDLQTGRELWEFHAGRGITAPVAVGQGVVVVGDLGGSVYCLEPE